MKKLILLPTLILTLTLVTVGCDKTDTNTNTNQNTVDENTNTTEENVNTNSSAEVDSSTEVSTEVDTSDWVSYENEEYGFSFEYPEDSGLEILTEGRPANDPGDIILTIDDQCVVNIFKPSDKGVEDVREAINSGKYDNLDVVESIDINDIKGIKYLGTVNPYGEEGYIFSLIINDKKVTYLLRYGNDDESCLSTSEEIIESLKLYF